MARETKAQRLAREALERLNWEAEQIATYPARLMSILERATNINFELTVKDGQFLLEDRDDHSDRAVVLTLEYSTANQEALHELDWRVDIKEDREREAQRRIQTRVRALNKLTQEEREVLGL